MSLRVLIVEDDPLIAATIQRYLKSSGYVVCGIAYEEEEALQAFETCQPEIILLDIHLGKGQEGISLGRHIHKHLNLPFIYLTAFADRGTLEKAKATAPAGYVVKPFTEKDIYAALEIAFANHQRNAPNEEIPALNTWEKELQLLLSEREIEIVKLIRDGYANQAIADHLFISINTVKTHLNHIYQKLEVGSRTGLLAKIRQ